MKQSDYSDRVRAWTNESVKYVMVELTMDSQLCPEEEFHTGIPSGGEEQILPNVFFIFIPNFQTTLV